MKCQCEHASHYTDEFDPADTPERYGCDNDAAVQVSASYKLCIECVNAEHMLPYLQGNK